MIEKIEPPEKNHFKRNLAIGLFVLMLVIVGYESYEQIMRNKYSPLKNKSDVAVTIYTTTWCGYCKQLRAYLVQQKITFNEYDVENSEQGYWGHKSVKGRGVPVMVIDDQIFYGFGQSNLPKINMALVKLGYKIDR